MANHLEIAVDMIVRYAEQMLADGKDLKAAMATSSFLVASGHIDHINQMAGTIQNDTQFLSKQIKEII